MEPRVLSEASAYRKCPFCHFCPTPSFDPFPLLLFSYSSNIPDGLWLHYPILRPQDLIVFVCLTILSRPLFPHWGTADFHTFGHHGTSWTALTPSIMPLAFSPFRPLSTNVGGPAARISPCLLISWSNNSICPLTPSYSPKKSLSEPFGCPMFVLPL